MTTTSQPSTTLFAVPRERFLELKEARHLRRLADALLGAKRPSVIGLIALEFADVQLPVIRDSPLSPGSGDPAALAGDRRYRRRRWHSSRSR